MLAGGKVIDFERIDPEVEGALIGARRAAERAAEAVRRFAAEHLDDLAAERLKTAKELKRNGTTRDNLVKDLKDSTRLDRNGLVIIPVAIYK